MVFGCYLFDAKYFSVIEITIFRQIFKRHWLLGIQSACTSLDSLQGCTCTLQERSVRWIRSFLTERSQCVKIGNSISSARSVPTGVPQGGVLSPLVFNYLKMPCQFVYIHFNLMHLFMHLNLYYLQLWIISWIGNLILFLHLRVVHLTEHLSLYIVQPNFTTYYMLL